MPCTWPVGEDGGRRRGARRGFSLPLLRLRCSHACSRDMISFRLYCRRHCCQFYDGTCFAANRYSDAVPWSTCNWQLHERTNYWMDMSLHYRRWAFRSHSRRWYPSVWRDVCPCHSPTSHARDKGNWESIGESITSKSKELETVCIIF